MVTGETDFGAAADVAQENAHPRGMGARVGVAEKGDEKGELLIMMDVL